MIVRSLTHSRLASVFLGFALTTAAAQATTYYSFTGTVNSDSENAQVGFTISNCSGGACQLDILITNNITSPTDAGQGIIGLSFNIGSLTSGGTLNSTVTNGSSSPVPEINLPGGGSAGSTSSPAEWTFGYETAANAGCLSANVFCLDGHSLSHNPMELIIGAGASGGNSSVGNFNPWLAGPVDFEIDNFTGLSLTSTFTNVTMDFGTNPDGSLTGDPCPTCGGVINRIPPVPEPWSFGLAGSGLLALGLYRRFAR
jgi:hypothetical protein